MKIVIDKQLSAIKEVMVEKKKNAERLFLNL